MIRQIGRYEVRAELGRGGFGRVYRAWDPKVGRWVAIKTLTAGGDGEMLQRFRNEAAAAGKIQHKNIVTIYDFGEHESEPFIVMELLEGEDLSKIIGRREPLTLLQKMLIMSQVADGLYHAHLEGIVHRDVKPGNIMVLPGGAVKLMDFGIALVTQAAGARLTKTGMVPGTLRYMAPEQFRGATNDPLSDIFSFGVTYYELLCYKHPFDGPTEPSMMYNILTAQPPPLREMCPGCPEALEHVLLRAMHKDRELRYASFDDLRDDLRPAVAELQQQRGAELIEQASGFMAEGKLAEARSAVREALELDPANTTGHRLRKQLQQELQLQVTRPRVAALLTAGKEQLRERRFDEAIASFESALQLNPADSAVRSAISEARLASEHSRKADQLALEAYQVLKAGDVTAARQKASLAVQTDPGSPRAVAIMQRVEETLRSRERARNLQAGLDQAKAALLVGSVQEAIGLLTALRTEYPGEAEVETLFETAKRERSARERRLHIEERTAAAKELIRSERLNEAASLLRGIASEFPEASGAQDLLRQVEVDLAARQRAEAVARAGAEAEALLREERFQAAREVLERALAALGEERTLQELLSRVAATESGWLRRRAIEETRASAGRLRAELRFGEALRRIDACLEAHGPVPELEELRRAVEEDAARHKRHEEISRAESEARRLLGEGDASAAIGVLLEAIGRQSAEAELSGLLDQAESALVAQSRREEIAGIAKEARRLAGGLNFAEARALLDRSLAAHPGEAELERAMTETAAAEAAHQRRLERDRALEGIRRALSGGEAERAARELAEAERQFGRDQATEALGRAVRAAEEAALRERRLGNLRAEARSLLAGGRFEDALCTLEAARREFPEDAELRARQEEASAKLHESRRALKAAEARELIAAGSFDEAIQLLDRALPEHAGEAELVELRAQASQAREARRREQARREAVESALAAARQLLDGDQPAEAVRSLESAPPDVREDAAVTALLQQARADLERKQQVEDAVSRAVARAAQLIQAGSFDEALALLDRSLGEFPGHARLLERRAEAEAAGRAFQEEKAREETRRVRREYVARIEALAREERFADALALLGEAERTCGEDAGFTPLRTKLEEARARHERALARRRDLDQLWSLDRKIAAGVDRQEAKALGKEARRLAKQYPKDREFQEVAARIDAAIRAKPEAPTPPRPGSRRWLLAGVGVAAMAAVVVTAVVFSTRGGRPEAPVARDAASPAPAPARPSPGIAAREPAADSPGPPPASERRAAAPAQETSIQSVPKVETAAPAPAPAPAAPQPTPAPPQDPAAEAAAAWQRASASPNVAALEEFLARFPNSAQRAAAEQRLDELRWAAVDKGNLAAVREFARQYPRSRHAEEAAEAAQKLEWDAVDKNNPAALEEFRRRASGAYANLAAREIERLRQARTQAEQRAAGARLQNDRQAILAVLARHSAAYEKEDVNEILATWPGYPAGSLNALRKAFQTRGTTVRMTLRPLGEPDVLGDRATVQCEQVREAVMGGARRNPDSRRVKVTLGRRGVGWVIEQVE